MIGHPGGVEIEAGGEHDRPGAEGQHVGKLVDRADGNLRGAALHRLLGQPGPPGLDQLPRPRLEILIAQGGDGGGLGRYADVERLTDAVEQVSDCRLGDTETDPQAGQPISFRQGT